MPDAAPREPVDSEHRVELSVPAVAPSADGALRLGAAYWEEVSRFSRGLVRPRFDSHGVVLVLRGRGILLRFGPAEATVGADIVACRYPILGGLLAAAPGGSLVIEQTTGERLELRLAVQGFHPRLARQGRLARVRSVLYDALQAPLHADISRRYLARASRGPL